MMTVQIENGRVVGYITAREFAARCSVKEGTVRIWAMRGKIIPLKIGSDLWIKEDTKYPDRKNKRSRRKQVIL